MSEPNDFSKLDGQATPEAPDEALQFDQAEFATPEVTGPACAVCKQPLVDEYHELNGKVFCARCRQGVELAFRGGSGLVRLLKALVLGTIAAVVGAVIYYAIMHLTGYNIGLVAVVIGLMVGGAVRKGSGNRGGLGYQFLAAFLTYSAIVAMLIPQVIEAAAQNPREQQAEEPKAAKADSKKLDADKVKPPEVATRPGVAPAPAVAGKAGKAAKATAAKDGDVIAELPRAQPPPAPSLPMLLVAFAFIVAFAYAIPVLVTFNAPISGLIFGFALWEAWKINRRLNLTFNGPFRLSAAVPGSTSPEGVEDEP